MVFSLISIPYFLFMYEDNSPSLKPFLLASFTMSSSREDFFFLGEVFSLLKGSSSGPTFILLTVFLNTARTFAVLDTFHPNSYWGNIYEKFYV